MGHTELVKHAIYTGDHCPVCLPSGRLSITKQDIEKEEVRKMLTHAVIEPCQSSWASLMVLVTKKRWYHQVWYGLLESQKMLPGC